MAFTVPCTNKGCGKIQAPYIDQTDDKVYCSECDREIPGITNIVKHQMKMNKQFRPKKQTPYAVKCPRCGKDDKPRLVGQDIVCAGCLKPLDHLSEPFKIMLRDKLRSID